MIRASVFAALFGILGLGACSPQSGDKATDTAAAGQVVNLYTARHYDSDQALYDRFTKETGITVKVIEGKAEQLIERMKTEGAASPADLFIAADAGMMWRAAEAGLLQPAPSDAIASRIPANLREPGGLWTGFMRRARVVAYDSARVKPAEVDSYEKLAGPRFAGKLCVRSSDNVYNLSLMGALIEAWGPERAGRWAQGIVANMARPPEGGDRDQIRAVGAGVCEVALTNSYYYIRMAAGDDAADQAVTKTVKLAFPSLDGQGSHVNISGMGIAKNAPNRDNAVRLMEFFAAAPSQAHIAQYNNEFPASADVPPPAAIAPFATFAAHPMPVAAFAARQPEAQALMAKAGWR